MHGVGIAVHGQMDWKAGDVSVTNAATETSLIEVHGEGVFNVRAAGSWTGGAADSFIVLNHGLVNKETATTSDLGGTYVSIGTTHVKAGTLAHLGKVQVSAGAYKVDQNAIAWVRGWTDGLRVYNGELTGGGKVDGNVNLSYYTTETNLPPGLQTTAGTIHPIAGQTITITGGLRMRSTSAYMRIDFDANGAFSKVVVLGGAAYLKGTLYVDKDGGFNPGAGSFTFLTATAISEDFTTEVYSPPYWYADAPASQWRTFQRKKIGNTYLLEVIDPAAPPVPPPPDDNDEVDLPGDEEVGPDTP